MSAIDLAWRVLANAFAAEEATSAARRHVVPPLPPIPLTPLVPERGADESLPIICFAFEDDCHDLAEEYAEIMAAIRVGGKQ